ncbi:hypothetical protein ZIOFF_001351 [Zingiber officinale]|uniref:Protein kinase domain-containing protein n=1 Tax=Zingiber officinale TaxID=94328 RepID=A0A8J5LUZ1_ZINOF|nr:hypothetical protein ZIOFF_001351 [Zingiber officinale]
MAVVTAPSSGLRRGGCLLLRITQQREPPERHAFRAIKDERAMSSGAMNKAGISGDLSSIPKFPQIEILHQIEIDDEDEVSKSSDSESNDDLELSKVIEMRLLPSDAGKCSFLFLQMTTPISIENVRREVKILKALSNHNNFVKFYDACEDALNVYVVMEYVLINSSGRYSEEDAKAIVIQILSVIAFCHLQGVVHCDLKPENFLFTTRDENAQMKLIDFGLSDFVKPGSSTTNIQTAVPGQTILHPSNSIHQNLEALSKALTEDHLFYLRSQFKLLAPNREGHISFDNFRMALLQNAIESMKESKVNDILNVARHPFLLPFFFAVAKFLLYASTITITTEFICCSFDLFEYSYKLKGRDVVRVAAPSARRGVGCGTREASDTSVRRRHCAEALGVVGSSGCR